ncbi:MAG TPA: cysteine desulfurase [Candidatus Nanoarchaeia archaeon]|nr:cysteine desulfurase [Candidatus Nanoarchaeia archaeon]
MANITVLDAERVRKDFPFFARGLVYLDSAATTQKPKIVLDAIRKFYETSNANVHRGVYSLAEEATQSFELARKKVADFIGANPREIVFVRNATEAINLVAQSWGNANISKGDTILLTEMEHHSNIVPWQMLSKKVGSKISYLPITERGELDKNATLHALSQKPKLFAFTHISNVLGTINPAKEMISEAHKQGIPVLLDASQSVPHMPVNVKDLDCDFLVFSGHKMLAPFGVGVLYAKRELLDKMAPVLGGGDMIKEVHFDGALWNEVPWKFEAGTPDVAGVVGLGAAVDYLQSLGMENVWKHGQDLVKYAYDKMKKDDIIAIYGPENRAGLISFNLGDMHAHDVSTVLDQQKVCARSGHHCAQPLMERLGVPATVRISFGPYNSKEDVDAFLIALQKAKKVFRL